MASSPWPWLARPGYVGYLIVKSDLALARELDAAERPFTKGDFGVPYKAMERLPSGNEIAVHSRTRKAVLSPKVVVPSWRRRPIKC
jgi:hypothetical protein